MDFGIVLSAGQTARPPQLEGPSNDAFLAAKIVFCKPKWMADDQVSECPGCSTRFSTVRRKHHCRQCGLVFCHNCCHNKILLPYLGYADPMRVCEQCRPYIQVMLMAFSQNGATRCEAGEAWSEMVQHAKGVKEVVESGGAHILVFLAKEKNLRLRSLTLKCFHALAVYSGLQRFLVQIGIIKAICRILVDSANQQTTLLMDALNLLLQFCRDPELRSEVLEDGAMSSVLEYFWQTDRPSAPVALECINCLCEHDKGCDTIVNCHDKHYLSKLMSLAKDKDDKIQEMSFRILANISSGSDYHRQRILQEEVFSGGSLAAVLINRPKNVQSLVNITCLMANLAVTQNTQGGLMDHLQGMCSLIKDFSDHVTLMQQVSRGLANFSRFKHNCDMLKDHFPTIISAFLCSSDSRLRQRGFQISLALLEHSPQACIAVLHRQGVSQFLECLSERKEALVGIQRGIQDQQPEVLRPVGI